MVLETAQSAQAAEVAPAAEVAGILDRLRRRFTVDEYYRMAEAGILHPEERVELLDGEIIQMSPIGSPHASSVKRLNHVFSRSVGQRAVVSVQDPIRLNGRSEPEPDLALLRPRADFYAGAHPRPEDILLVVEVADSSTAYDRRVKLPRYAQAGIPEVWLLVLAEPRDSGTTGNTGTSLEVYRQPSSQGYRLVLRPRRGERLAPRLLPDVELAVDEVLGEE
ncbi:MAG: Uma2 family endonuclease [Chloroflexota bacterium]